ncbi:MAG: poly-gamma-glutamate biosynthesis protein PgsC [Acidobacteria bacterium]|nr:poly-gamma-glutamate biosynthesis protein PgsC [Acidobacteriota bacterium]
MVELAIGLGIALNLVCTELFGLASGGLVVPGYLALYINEPARVLATLSVSAATFAVVRYGLMRVVILYGRRRFGVTILTGFVLHGVYGWVLASAPAVPADLRIIGYIVPGLLANAALTQGLWATIGMTLSMAVVVRLLLVAAGGLVG